MGQVAQVLIAVAIQFTFGLQFFVPMDILWRKLAPGISKEKHNMSQIALRAGCILIMGAVAAAVPKLDPFISLVGAIFFSFLGKYRSILDFHSVQLKSIDLLIFTIFFFTGLFVPAAVETIFRYPDDFGVYNIVLIKNLFLMVFSIIALATGSLVSIHEIASIYS